VDIFVPSNVIHTKIAPRTVLGLKVESGNRILSSELMPKQCAISTAGLRRERIEISHFDHREKKQGDTQVKTTAFSLCAGAGANAWLRWSKTAFCPFVRKLIAAQPQRVWRMEAAALARKLRPQPLLKDMIE
jgi:hypothetical protein